MSDFEIEELRSLHVLQATAPPPPSPTLVAKVESMGPVRTRAPLRALLVVAAAAGVFPLGAVAVYPWRRDLSALPAAWLVAVAGVWAAGFVVPLWLALVPRSGQVLPDGTRASRAAVLSALTLLLVGLFFTVDAPGFTIVPSSTWEGFFRLWWHCVSFGLKVTVPTVLVGAFALRPVAVASLARLGAAIGAAGGALSGLVLHGLCPYGGAAHVGLAHGGGVAIGALLGALWMPLLVGKTSRDARPAVRDGGRRAPR
jgi:hypothetical protein